MRVPFSCVLSLAAASAAAQPITALRITEHVRVDGRLDEPMWQRATAVTDFRQLQPDEGAPASLRTEVRMLYDGSALYFGFTCFDPSPNEIVARLSRRDEDTASDQVSVELDTRGTHASAFQFRVSAANVQLDSIRTGDDAYAVEWDAVWTSAVALDATGWTAELRIPLTALRFDRGDEHSWRAQLGRFVSRTNEQQLWAFKPRSEFGELARFRPVEGIDGLDPPEGVELRSYVLGAAHLNDGEAPGTRASLGLDLRWAVTPGLSFDATVLPDFGQVEADPALLNLTTFEIQFPEKRPFFLESADLYSLRDAFGENTAAQLFYSRRIGASPILGAAKLSGRIGETVTVGLLDAVTLPEGEEPLANYAVARASVALPKHVGIGGTVVDVHRAEGGRSASAVEADASWSGFDGAWTAAAHLFGSRVHSGETRTLVDGTVLKAGDFGAGARVEVAKPAGLIVGEALFETYSPTLELNEVGYLQRQNLHRLFVQLGFQLFKVGPFQQSKTAIEVFGRESWDGAAILRGANFNNYTLWNNFWHSWLELQWNAVAYENRELRDGNRFERPQFFGLEWSLGSNTSKAVSFSFWGVGNVTRVGGMVDTGLDVTAHLGDRLSLSLSPTLLRVAGDVRWVETLSEGSYRFGLQDAVGAGATLRASFTFTPKMSLQLYSQLFFTDVRYLELFEGQAAARYVTLASLERSAADPAAYAEHEVSLNVNVVFRWELLPGSMLYLVYTRKQGGAPVFDSESLRPRLDFEGLRRVGAENTFLVKVAYYFAR